MVEEITEERVLTLEDRCDAKQCGAAALVKITGVSGDLYFCGHHYKNIEGSDSLKNFAFDIVDERWSIYDENRLKGEN